MPTYQFERAEKIVRCDECPFLFEEYDDIGGMCYDAWCCYEADNSKNRGYLYDDETYEKPDWCPLKEVDFTTRG